ncbi:hypothetical protein VTP01DRAFT_9476 [Rhizomucor pusillus]|uniref:uncharacterized protein n=1 Tax=Rhizomucor pusillus TaxID=4840 RepID=UPI00374497BA
MMLDTENELYGVSSITRIGCHLKVATIIQNNGYFIAELHILHRPGIKVLKDNPSDDDDDATEIHSFPKSMSRSANSEVAG